MNFLTFILVQTLALGGALAQTNQGKVVPSAGPIARVLHIGTLNSKRKTEYFNAVQYTEDVLLSSGLPDDAAKNFKGLVNEPKLEFLPATQMKLYNVLEVVRHENFQQVENAPSPRAHSDIAVLKLKTDVKGECRKVILAEPTDDFSGSKTMKMVGWISTKPKGKKNTYFRLKSSIIKPKPDSYCKSYSAQGGKNQSPANNFGLDSGSEMCAYSAILYNKRSKGSALFNDYGDAHPTLVGLYSWGQCTEKKCKPIVFVNIGSFSEWIEKTVDDLSERHN